MANDPYWNNVVLAMHMDDPGLTDLKGHAVTLNGNVGRSATQSKFGGYSAAFDGAGDYAAVAASSDFNLFAGDFTIEFYVYFNSLSNYPHLVNIGTVEANRVGLYMSSSCLKVFSKDGTSTYATILTSPALATGAWIHVALVKNNGTWALFIDGVLAGTSTSGIIPTGVLGVGVGFQQFGGVTGDYLNGYIDDLRITKGVARYTANFTPPTEAFPDTQPQLIGTVKDSSNAFAARTVRAYRRSDGALAGSTTSNGTTGAFSVSALDATAHYAVCLDNDLDENALILDNITPV